MNDVQIALAALGLALASPALAGEAVTSRTTQTQEREQVRAQVHHQLAQGGVSEQEATDLDADVSAHAAHAGYGPAIRSAIQESLANGCKGTCLADVVRGINGSIDKGATPDQAAAAATKTHASGMPSDPQARSQDHRRDMAHRDAAADRVHDRTMDRGQAGSHAMGAGHR